MKKYRCPWCGKKGMDKHLHIFRFLPPMGNTSLYNNPIICSECRNLSNFAPKKENKTSSLFFLISGIGVILAVINFFTLKSWWLFVVTVLMALSIKIRDGIIRSRWAVLTRYGKGETKINTPYIVSLEKPLKLNIENIFTIRLTEVKAEEIMAKTDLIAEYNQEGVPVYIAHLQNDDYRMGLIRPEFCKLEQLKPNVKFEVYDDVGVVSVGEITDLFE